MKSIIHSYLNEHFIFVGGKIRSKSAYNRSQEPFSYVYFNDTLSKIIEELCLIFALTKKELKYYIKGWVRKQNRGFDFEKYWNPPKIKFGIYFPMIRQIHARTIAMDLARVEPLDEPRGILMNWDHHVEQPEPILNNPVIERYANRVVNPNFYGVINITGTTIEQVNQIQEEERREPLQRIIDLWDPILNPRTH